MSSATNVQLIRDFYDALEKGDNNRYISLIAPDAVFKVIGMEQPSRGHQEISRMFQEWSQAFPDMKTEVVNLISTDEWVVVEEINRGTHKGTLQGSEGTLPPTNRKIEVPACNIYRIVNGKIASWTVYWATDVMLAQLGYQPQKQAA